MKAFKLVLILLAVALLIGALLAGSGFYMMRGAPSWYSRQSDPNAAASLENKLVVYYDRMAAARAWRVRHPAATGSAAARVSAVPATDPTLEPFDLQFTDSELNAFFDKWASADDRREAKMDQYVHDPRILLQSGKLVLAATVRDLGAVVSIEIVPRLDDAGQLSIGLSRAYAGMLPLPDSVWSSRRAQIQRLLTRRLRQDQQSARLSADGVANGPAAAAAMIELLINTLNHQPAEPVLFLPFDAAHPGKSVPVKVDQLKLGDGSIALRVKEMGAGERAALLQRVCTPIGGDAADPESDGQSDPHARAGGDAAAPTQ